MSPHSHSMLAPVQRQGLHSAIHCGAQAFYPEGKADALSHADRLPGLTCMEDGEKDCPLARQRAPQESDVHYGCTTAFTTLSPSTSARASFSSSSLYTREMNPS